MGMSFLQLALLNIVMQKRLRLQILLLVLAFAVGSHSVIPLEAGTLFVEDQFLRLNTCTFRNVELALSKETFEATRDIQAVAAIRHMKMNDQLTFQIFYSIECSEEKCILAFKIQRTSLKVDPFFTYELTIDFLVATQLDVVSVNMTNHRQLFAFRTELQGGQLRKAISQSPKMVPILIPVGFNNLALTGSIRVRQLTQQNLFVLEYHPQSGPDSVEWKMNKYFVYFKVVLLSQEYIDSFKEGAYQSFSGFSSTTLKEINTESTQQSVGFSIPLSYDPSFLDNRKSMIAQSASKPPISQSSQKDLLLKVCLSFLLFVCLQIAYRTYHKQTSSKNAQTKLPKAANQQPPSELISIEHPSHNRQDAVSGFITAERNETEAKVCAS